MTKEEEIFEAPEVKEVKEDIEKKENPPKEVVESLGEQKSKEEPKPRRVRKVIDEETRSLIIDKLNKSRKIKDLTIEKNELKEKLEKLEASTKDSVPIIKEEQKVKKTITRKIKTIEEPIQKEEVKSLKPLVAQVAKAVPQPQQPPQKPQVVFSTYRQPIW